MGGGTGGVSGKGVQWTNNPLYTNSKGEKPNMGKTGETGDTGKAKSTTLKGDKGEVSVKQQKTNAKKLGKKTAAEGKKLTASQKKAEAKEAKKAAKAEKAVQKEAAKTEKAAKKQQLKEAAAAKKEAKVMAKLSKKLASGKATISAPVAAQTKTSTSAAGTAINAKEMLKPGVITDKMLFGGLNQLSAKEKDQRETLRTVLADSAKACKELEASNPKEAAELKKDICAILDKVSDVHADKVKDDMSRMSTEYLPSYSSSFLRENGVESVMFSRVGGFNKFGEAGQQLADEVKNNPELVKLLQDSSKNSDNSDATFTETQQKTLKDFVDKAISSMGNPDSLDKDIAACLKHRFEKIETAVKDGLKDNKNFTDAEKDGLVKQFSTASIHNELCLRWINPTMNNAAQGCEDKEVGRAMVGLMKGTQIAFNAVSGKTDLKPEDLVGFAEKIKTNGKSFLYEFTGDSVSTANNALKSMTDRILGK